MRASAHMGTLLSLLAVVAGTPAAGAATPVSSSAPYPGITYQVYQDAAIGARIHVLVVDLSSSEISLAATSESQRGRTPSSFSAVSMAQIAVNGDYFSPVDYSPAGLAMGDAQLWSNSTDDATSGFLRFDLNGGRTNADISAPADVVDPTSLPAGTQGVIGGRPMLVRSGLVETGFDCTDFVAMPCERSPRTAVAVSSDGNTLWIAVVDGWQAASFGMTAAELGAFLRDLGAYGALMLDGGGASSMYIAAEGGTVSSPSDGIERPVANHLGVRYGALPPGQLVGLIRERDIYDDTANIEGATVALDDGREAITGPDGRYSFQVSPRWVCATASKAGYRSATRCKQVSSGAVEFNSIPLFPNSDFIDAAPGAPDAGVSDGGVPFADSGPTNRDSGPGGDGGSGGGGGDGCLAIGGETPGMMLVLWALVLALPVSRRRC